jgi:hypothetical protein
MRAKRRTPLSLNLNARWRKFVNVKLWLLYPSWGEPSYPVKWSQGATHAFRLSVDEKILF